MFDSVLDRGSVPKRQIGSGTIISIVAHGLILATVVYLSSRPHQTQKADVDVKFMAAAPPPPPPPPPPPGGGSMAKKEETKPKPVKKPDTMVESKDKEKPKEEAKEEKKDEKPQEGGQEGGVQGGVQGGVVGGTVGGVVGGVIGGTLGGTGTTLGAPLPAPKNYSYDRSLGMVMAKPTSGSPTMSREALTAKVEGLVLLKCTITKGGRATNCVIVKGLPFMNDVVLAWARSATFTPVTLAGQPIDCDNVTFPLRFKQQ